MTNLTKVLTDLQTLSQNELHKVKATVDFLLTKSPEEKGAPDHRDTYESLLYSALSSEFNNSLKMDMAPYLVFKKTNPLSTKFKALSKWLDEYLEKLLDTKIVSRRERMKFYTMYVKMTMKILSERKIPVSIKTVIEHQKQFPDTLDRNFPGYARSGLFRLVFNNKKATWKKNHQAKPEPVYPQQ